LSLRILFSKIASLRSVQNDISAKPCNNCKMIMVNYADLWLIYSHAASLLDSAKLELRKLIPHCLVLVLAVPCLDLIWRLRPLRLNILSTNLFILLVTLFYPLCVKHVSLSSVSFSMLPKRTRSYNRMLLI
jgi:hypothetical protein